MYLKVISFFLLIFVHTPAFPGTLEDYISKVKNECSGLNELVIKKSLIEITQSQNCEETFTTKILNDCSKISCSALLNHWSAFNTAKNGAVIGK